MSEDYKITDLGQQADLMLDNLLHLGVSSNYTAISVDVTRALISLHSLSPVIYNQ